MTCLHLVSNLIKCMSWPMSGQGASENHMRLLAWNLHPRRKIFCQGYLCIYMGNRDLIISVADIRVFSLLMKVWITKARSCLIMIMIISRNLTDGFWMRSGAYGYGTRNVPCMFSAWSKCQSVWYVGHLIHRAGRESHISHCQGEWAGCCCCNVCCCVVIICWNIGIVSCSIV